MIYRAIGKAVVKYSVLFLWGRYRRQIRIGAVLAAGAIGVAAYFAAREVPEG